MRMRRGIHLWRSRWLSRRGAGAECPGATNATSSVIVTSLAAPARADVGNLTLLGRRRRAAAALAALLAAFAVAPAPARAVVVGGGGSPRVDCLAVFEAAANVPARRPTSIRCTDGDPTCDADGVVNGVCEFSISICANSDADPACTLRGVDAITIDHAVDDGDPKFDPAFQAIQARVQAEIDPPTSAVALCTTAISVPVPIRGPLGAGVCKSTKQVLSMVTLSTLIGGKIYRDADVLKMRCDPAPTGCDAQVLFAGTFDRIQRQIFDQSCAVSGCHDSQSRTGDLLLEPGAAYTNLVNVAPSNLNANAAGWKRVHVVDATSGDPATSLLLQKLLGPPLGFGARMPFNRRPLDRTLIDVVELWIAAGAPATGWVPGTD